MNLAEQQRVSVIVVIVSGILLLSSPLAVADQNKAILARTLWFGFRCSAFAQISGERTEQERLFQVGLKAGHAFLEALRGGQVSDDELNNEVPLAVTLLLWGPTTDFMLGRIYESALNAALDDVVRTKNGLAVDTDDQLVKDEKDKRDQKDKKLIAHTHFLQSSCALIQ
jgi:hypothetical protein